MTSSGYIYITKQKLIYQSQRIFHKEIQGHVLKSIRTHMTTTGMPIFKVVTLDPIATTWPRASNPASNGLIHLHYCLFVEHFERGGFK